MTSFFVAQSGTVVVRTTSMKNVASSETYLCVRTKKVLRDTNGYAFIFSIYWVVNTSPRISGQDPNQVIVHPLRLPPLDPASTTSTAPQHHGKNQVRSDPGPYTLPHPLTAFYSIDSLLPPSSRYLASPWTPQLWISTQYRALLDQQSLPSTIPRALRGSLHVLAFVERSSDVQERLPGSGRSSEVGGDTVCKETA